MFEKNSRQPYNGDLCLFRALAVLLYANDLVTDWTERPTSFLTFSSLLLQPDFFSEKLETICKELLSFNRKKEVTCENYGTHNTMPNLAPRKTKYPVGFLYCPQYPVFPIYLQGRVSSCSQQTDVPIRCKVCNEDFFGFCTLRQHKSSQHGVRTKSSNNNLDSTGRN